jgi:hypothetical protein
LPDQEKKKKSEKAMQGCTPKCSHQHTERVSTKHMNVNGKRKPFQEWGERG